MNRIVRAALFTASLTLALSLVGCGGGAVSGTVSGLDSGLSVALQDNATDTITVTTNGDFSFGPGLKANATYDVTVLTQPAGQTCDVANGSGSLDVNANPVDDVSVTCTNTSSVVGTLSGLASGAAVTLTNGTTPLTLATNGSFAFPGLLDNGAAIDITVSIQPIRQTCTVTNGVSTFVTGTQTSITVVCS